MESDVMKSKYGGVEVEYGKVQHTPSMRHQTKTRNMGEKNEARERLCKKIGGV